MFEEISVLSLSDYLLTEQRPVFFSLKKKKFRLYTITEEKSLNEKKQKTKTVNPREWRNLISRIATYVI